MFVFAGQSLYAKQWVYLPISEDGNTNMKYIMGLSLSVSVSRIAQVHAPGALIEVLHINGDFRE